LHLMLDSQFELRNLDKNHFPKVYYFDINRQKSVMIPIDVEALVDTIRRTRKYEQTVAKPDMFKDKQLSGERKSPDGYKVISFDNAYMVGKDAIIFNLAKQGYLVKVAYPEEKVDFGHRAVFVGWITDETGRVSTVSTPKNSS